MSSFMRGAVRLGLWLVLLNPASLLAQTVNLGQAGIFESGFGAVPNLTGAWAISVSGNYGYVVGNGNALEILDITIPSLPQHKATLVNGEDGAVIEGPRSVFATGNLVFIGNFLANSVEIVDVSDPAHPKHRGLISHGVDNLYINQPFGISVVGNYAYIASNGGGAIEIVDISNPANPTHKGRISSGTGGSVLLGATSLTTAMIKNDLYAFVTANNSVVEIVKVTDPSNPTHVSKITGLGFPADVAISGNNAFVPCTGSGSVVKIKISDPANPVIQKTLTNPGGSGATAGYLYRPWSVAVSGAYAYTSGENGGLTIADTTNFNVTKGVVMPELATIGNYTKSIVVLGNNGYVTSPNGITVLENLSSPLTTSPSIKTSVLTGAGGSKMGAPRQVYVSENTAYVASSSDRFIEIIDVSTPSDPKHLSSIAVGDVDKNGPRAVFVDGTNAYTVTENGLFILDVNTPAAPRIISKLYDGGGAAPYLFDANDVVVSTINNKKYAFVAVTGRNALEIINVTDPANPFHAGVLKNGSTDATAPFLAQPTHVRVLGNTAYLISTGTYNGSTVRGSLQIVNVTTPESPSITGMGSLTGIGAITRNSIGGNNLAVKTTGANTYAYIANSVNGQLEIVDVTNLASPQQKSGTVLTILAGGTIASGPFVRDFTGISLYDNYALIAYNGGPFLGGVYVVDVSSVTSPKHYQKFASNTDGALMDQPTSIFTTGKNCYVTNLGQTANLDVIDIISPKITQFTPNSGPVGTLVKVTGANFSSFITASLNGVNAAVSNLTNNELYITIPDDAEIGKVMLGIFNQRIRTTTNFIVTPQLAQSQDVTTTSFTASWSNVKASIYFIDVSKDNFATFLSGFANKSVGTATSFNITGLTPGTQYQVRVRSSDGNSVSVNSNTGSIVTLPSKPVLAAANDVTQTSFIANWNAVQGAVGYYLDISTDADFSTFLIGGHDISLNSNSYSVNRLDPFTKYFYRVVAYNASGKSDYSDAADVTTIDNVSPSITASSFPNPTTVTAGNTPSINVTINDNVEVESAMIYYRGISQKEFTATSLQGPGGTGGNYSITIQTTWYDSLGMEYYFEAKDPAGNESISQSSYVQLISPSLTLPALPSGDDVSAYRIVSFPYTLLSDNNVSTVYNNVPWNDNTKAALWWWNPATTNYDQYNGSGNFQTIDRGKGYWVITREPVTPQLTNVPASTYNQNNLFVMTLKPGWNQIGNPYPVSISWDDVIEWNKKAAPSASFSKLSVYDGSGIKESSGSRLLHAFEGGFVKNNATTEISIQIPFRNQENGTARKGILLPDLDEDAWDIFMHVGQNGMINELGGFGMDPNADVGEDRFDGFNPPNFLEVPELHFGNLSNDVVNTQSEYAWRFTIDAKAGAQTELKWSEYISNNGKQLLLLDEESLIVTDMSETQSYSFVMSDASRFKIFYGKDVRIVTDNIIAGKVYPNPLRDHASAAVKISLPDNNKSYSVNAQVLNLQGVVLRTLNTSLSPGIHELQISADDLPAGVYIYRVGIVSGQTSKSFIGKLVKE